DDHLQQIHENRPDVVEDRDQRRPERRVDHLGLGLDERGCVHDRADDQREHHRDENPLPGFQFHSTWSYCSVASILSSSPASFHTGIAEYSRRHATRSANTFLLSGTSKNRSPRSAMTRIGHGKSYKPRIAIAILGCHNAAVLEFWQTEQVRRF